MNIELAGETLALDHRRALVWPRHSALVIADTHFGKSAVFRREGIPLPEGSDLEDLALISRLLREHDATNLYILGDFVHGHLPGDHGFYRTFNHWRESHRGVGIHVVLGNHDRHLDPGLLRGIEWHRRLELAPLALVHEPDPGGDSHYLAGHIHPVVRLSTRADSLRLPVFWRRERGLVLPSFGSLTGGYAITPRRGEAVYAIGTDAVHPVTAR